ncbi:unnamed protein product [Ilex paraguariensis]|uniref:Uncharacterized protein n=1 Tax=Ilex paraguariensis TaxID=185542 RepID=A0ABC8U420_9AQUA
MISTGEAGVQFANQKDMVSWGLEASSLKQALMAKTACKYSQTDTLLMPGQPQKGTRRWTSVLRGRDLLNANLKWQVGDIETFQALGQNWLPGVVNIHRHRNLHVSLPTLKEVSGQVLQQMGAATNS